MNVGDFEIKIHSNRAITIELERHSIYLDISTHEDIIDITKEEG